MSTPGTTIMSDISGLINGSLGPAYSTPNASLLPCGGNTTGTAFEYMGPITHLYERHAFSAAAIWVYKICIPMWYIVGIPGNVLAASVWIQRKMRKASSGIYLFVLALCHALFLVVHIPYALQEYWGYNTIHFIGVCNLYPPISYALQYSSPILVLCFTVERYISVCHPFLRERLCTPRRAVYVSIGMLLLCLALAAPQAYFRQYHSSNPKDDRCGIRESVYNPDPNYEGPHIFMIWAYLSEVLIFGIVPLTTLIFNSLVIMEARRLSAHETSVLHSSHGHKRATTTTLLAVSFYHIASVLPVTIIYVIIHKFPIGGACLPEAEIEADPTWSTHFKFNLIRSLAEMIGLSHYAVNLYIYLLSGKQFRLTLRNLICSTFCPKKLQQLRRFDNTCTDYNSTRDRTNSTFLESEKGNNNGHGQTIQLVNGETKSLLTSSQGPYTTSSTEAAL